MLAFARLTLLIPTNNYLTHWYYRRVELQSQYCGTLQHLLCVFYNKFAWGLEGCCFCAWKILQKGIFVAAEDILWSFFYWSLKRPTDNILPFLWIFLKNLHIFVACFLMAKDLRRTYTAWSIPCKAITLRAQRIEKHQTRDVQLVCCLTKWSDIFNKSFFILKLYWFHIILLVFFSVFVKIHKMQTSRILNFFAWNEHQFVLGIAYHFIISSRWEWHTSNGNRLLVL